MINIAIVEDEKFWSDQLGDYLAKFGQNNEEQFNIAYFSDAVTFLNGYRPVYDIIFLDIMMPDLDGMSAAEKLRETDSYVIIIFVTNMAQFAIKGYEVGATAFIVKPLSYYDFEMKLKRAIFSVKRRDEKTLVVSKGSGSIRIKIRDLMYVEVNGHRCRYHLTDTVIEGYNSIKKLEEILLQFDFMLCNNCYLVNPSFIKYVSGYTLKIGEDELLISHPRKKAFMQKFNEWVSKGGGGIVT